VLEAVSVDLDTPEEAAAFQELDLVDEGIKEDAEDPIFFTPDMPPTSTAAAQPGDPADAPRSGVCYPFPPLYSCQAAFEGHSEGPWPARTQPNPGRPNKMELNAPKRALSIYSGEHGGFTFPTAHQWDIVSNLVETLIPIEEVTLQVSHYDSSVSCIIPSDRTEDATSR